MDKGITRAEILKKLPNLKKGNFELYCARAGVTFIGMRPASKKRPHIMEYIYPVNAAEKIGKILESKT
jgi:hypothetical protein